jgi:hypothetical protein
MGSCFRGYETKLPLQALDFHAEKESDMTEESTTRRWLVIDGHGGQHVVVAELVRSLLTTLGEPPRLEFRVDEGVVARFVSWDGYYELTDIAGPYEGSPAEPQWSYTARKPIEV